MHRGHWWAGDGKSREGSNGGENTAVVYVGGTALALGLTREYTLSVVVAVMATPADEGISTGLQGTDISNEPAVETPVVGVKADAVGWSLLLATTLEFFGTGGIPVLRATPTMGEGILVAAIVSTKCTQGQPQSPALCHLLHLYTLSPAACTTWPPSSLI